MIQERGKIELRGFGSIGTYFLVGNENATEDELVGRSRRGLSFVSERSGTLDRKNKKKLLGRKNSTGGINITFFSVINFQIFKF